MEIQSQEIKQLNITAVFENIDYNSISATKIREIFKLNEKEQKNSPFIEFANTKILGMPNRQIDIIVESRRLQVNDKSGQEPSKSKLIENFQIAFDNLTNKSNLITYGFNYNILVYAKRKINFQDFLNNELLKTLSEDKVLGANVGITFTKNKKRYDLRIAPINSPFAALIYLNAHYISKKINSTQLKKQFSENYLELQKIINNL